MKGDSRDLSAIGIIASTLLPEILAKIFLHNQETYFDYGDQHDDEVRQGENDTRTVTQVCRHWREAAISCTFLWTRMAHFDPPCNNSYDKWINLVFQRCRGTPLHAEASLPPWDSSNTSSPLPSHFSPALGWQLMFLNLDKIGTLTIYVDHDESAYFEPALAYVLDHLKQPAPLLTELALRLNPSYSDFSPRTPSAPFLHVDTRLKRLKLGSIRITPDVARQSLSQLVLLMCDSNMGDYFHISTTEWLETLRELPQLQILSIVENGRGTPRVDPHVGIVELPQLTNLTLLRDMVDIADIITHLSIPLSTRLALVCAETAPGPDYQALATYIQRTRDYAAQGIVPDLVKVSVGDTTLEVVVFLKDSPKEHLELDLRYEGSFKPSDFDPPLTKWMSAHLGGATKVEHNRDYLHYDDPVDVDIVRQIFMTFRGAKSFATARMDLLVSAFELDQFSPGDSTGVLLPNVEMIENIPPRWTDQSPPTPWELLPRIANFVMGRKQANYHIYCFDAIPPTDVAGSYGGCDSGCEDDESDEDEDEDEEMHESEEAREERIEKERAGYVKFCLIMKELGVCVYNSNTVNHEQLKRVREEMRQINTGQST